jgi:uncharacterized protein (DUF58 family)
MYGLSKRSIDNETRIFNLVFNTYRWPRNLLVFLIIFGIMGFLPSRYGPHFKPRMLIFVFFPAAVIILSWIYVQSVSKGFKLLGRKLPEKCLEGERIKVELEISYNGVFPFITANLSENLPAVDILVSPEINLDFGEFINHDSCVVSYDVRLNRGFGQFEIGPTEIIVEDPFGFFSKKAVLDKTTRLEVWLNPPAPEDLDLVKDNALTPMGDSRSTQSGHGMDFYGIKEYVFGDDIRAISWLKTAQTGKPVIKQFERDTRPDLLVAVHTDRSQLRGFGFGNTLKRLLRISAAILSESQQSGLPTSFSICINNEIQHIKINSSVPVYGFLTELLSDLKPAEDGGLNKILDISMKKSGPGSIVIFLSQTIHLELDSLLNTLLSLKARGAKVALWAIDDSKMAKFSEKQENIIDKESFNKRLEEMGIDFLLFSSKRKTSEEL